MSNDIQFTVYRPSVTHLDDIILGKPDIESSRARILVAKVYFPVKEYEPDGGVTISMCLRSSGAMVFERHIDGFEAGDEIALSRCKGNSSRTIHDVSKGFLLFIGAEPGKRICPTVEVSLALRPVAYAHDRPAI